MTKTTSTFSNVIILGAPQDTHNRHHTAETDEDVMLLLLVVYASAWLAVVRHILVGNAI